MNKKVDVTEQGPVMEYTLTVLARRLNLSEGVRLVDRREAAFMMDVTAEALSSHKERFPPFWKIPRPDGTAPAKSAPAYYRTDQIDEWKALRDASPRKSWGSRPSGEQPWPTGEPLITLNPFERDALLDRWLYRRLHDTVDALYANDQRRGAVISQIEDEIAALESGDTAPGKPKFAFRRLTDPAVVAILDRIVQQLGRLAGVSLHPDPLRVAVSQALRRALAEEEGMIARYRERQVGR